MGGILNARIEFEYSWQTLRDSCLHVITGSKKLFLTVARVLVRSDKILLKVHSAAGKISQPCPFSVIHTFHWKDKSRDSKEAYRKKQDQQWGQMQRITSGVLRFLKPTWPLSMSLERTQDLWDHTGSGEIRLGSSMCK